MSSYPMPIWAIQRITAVLATEHALGRYPTNAVVARRTGLSERLVRRCLVHMAIPANKSAPPRGPREALPGIVGFGGK
jgi:hypothetical protein